MSTLRSDCSVRFLLLLFVIVLPSSRLRGSNNNKKKRWLPPAKLCCCINFVAWWIREHSPDRWERIASGGDLATIQTHCVLGAFTVVSCGTIQSIQSREGCKGCPSSWKAHGRFALWPRPGSLFRPLLTQRLKFNVSLTNRAVGQFKAPWFPNLT